MHDVFIIGGGISGLYFLYKYKFLNHKIGLLEKSDQLGGKLRTVYDKNQKILYETGPWRISTTHHRMIALCQELGLSLKKIEKDMNIYMYESNKKESIQIIESKKDPGLSVYDYFLYTKGKNYADHIDSKTGYNEILDMNSTINAYDAKNKKEIYYVLEQGFSHLVKTLSQKINKHYELYLNTFVIDICKKKDHYVISTICREGSNKFKKRQFNSKKIILACPLSSFKKWEVAKSFDCLLSSVSTYPLNHIYALCKQKPIFHDKKDFFIISENPLSQIISSNYDNHWLQVSYSGGKIASFWNRLCLDHKNNWKKKIKNECHKILKDCEIVKLRMYYWSEAIHMWNPCFGFCLEKMYSLSLYPNPVVLQDFFIVGETFSKNQGWCEGALETVDDVFHIWGMNPFVKLLDLSTIPYLIYKHRILNVKQWMRVHPGGKHPIENHVNEDVSTLWDTIHATDETRNHIICLQIGWKYHEKFYSID